MPKILAIESSCDETSASIIDNATICSNIIANQSIHEAYGGVVPELASREHQKNIVLVVKAALEKAEVSREALDAIAFTRGPGLMGALLVGVSFAKALALALDIPMIEVNHMEAHVLAHFIEEPRPPFPFLCLTVSGGHTQIVKIEGPLQMTVIGQSLDDAVGEAFDKTAKVLGLGYPGGPHIDRLAKEGNPKAFPFPSVNTPELNFSFSGIKTAFLNFVNKESQKDPLFVEKNLADICASVQYTLIKILIKKTQEACKKHNIKHVAIAGGVSANSGLREALKAKAAEQGWQVYIPAFEYCTDNAAMIAMAAHFKYEASIFADQEVSANPRLKINA